MSKLQDKIHSMPEYQAETAADQADAAQGTVDVPEQVAPVVSFEKGDIEFWMQAAMVVLLFLIYRELARANGRAALAGMANGVIQ